MGESFVDVAYRGLELGRGLKLRDVLPAAAYLEVPLPMPVGTLVDLTCDGGVRIPALVTAVHEQVGGSDQVPGMRVQPTLAGAGAEWWRGRIDAAAVAKAAADADARAEQTARAEADAAATATATAAQQAEAAASAEAAKAAEAAVKAAEAAKADEAVPVEIAATPSGGSKKNGKSKRARSENGADEQRPTSGAKPTVVMTTEAVQAALAAAAAEDEISVDDGKRTTVMDAIDISMITGEPPADVGAAREDDDSGEITIEQGEDEEETGASQSGKTPVTDGKPAKAKSPKRRKKR